MTGPISDWTSSISTSGSSDFSSARNSSVAGSSTGTISTVVISWVWTSCWTSDSTSSLSELLEDDDLWRVSTSGTSEIKLFKINYFKDIFNINKNINEIM